MATPKPSTTGDFHWAGKHHHRPHRHSHQHHGHPHHRRRHPHHDQRRTLYAKTTARVLRGMGAIRTAAQGAKAAAAQPQSPNRSSTCVVAATSPPLCQHVHRQRPGPARHSQAAAPSRSIPGGRALASPPQSYLAVTMLVRSSAILLGMCGSRRRQHRRRRHHRRHHHRRCWSPPAVHVALGRRRKAAYSSWVILSPSVR